MSLINKMLQDLDARGNQSGETMQPNIKSVPVPERGVARAVAIGGGLLVLVLAAAAVIGWRYWKPAAPATPAAKPAAVRVVVAPPVAVPIAAAVSAPAPGVPVIVPAAKPAPVIEIAPVPPPPAPKATAKIKPERSVQRAPVQKPKAVKKPEPVRPLAAPKPGRAANLQQRGENTYRSALSALEDGRVTLAIATLEQTLRIEPRHEAARQTLVGLLIENKRVDEATHALQAGLALDARQPGMAMLLARLQIENGGTGIDTLLRTLPYAGDNGDYHAFLAGALQRAQRHREAAEQYQAALRGAPQNGVWWMGLGISLQTEKRNAEAIDAFQHAKATGALKPELLAFVERKLQQLSR